MQALPQLNSRKVDVGVVVIVGILVYLGIRQVSQTLDRTTKAMTKPAGEALSDLFARLNGWEPVTLQPLMIRDFYLTSDYRLTADAERTLWKIDDYRPFLIELFGGQGAALKPQYHSLINVEITKRTLS